MQITKDWQGEDILCADELKIVQTRKDGKHVWIDEGIKYLVLATFTTSDNDGERVSVLLEYFDGMGIHHRSLEEVLQDMLKESPGTYHICKKGINDDELMFYQQYFEA